ncbi:MAG TPA: glycosyltransferase family 4 protein [Pirellulales bacterium]|nr:glycosyltransferase family 4 protein [Pirellulales bacterium]
MSGKGLTSAKQDRDVQAAHALADCANDDSNALAQRQAGRRPRKVLHVFNSAGGGAALSTLGIIERLRREGISACAVCHDAGTEGEREQIHQATDGAVLFTPLYWWNKKIRAALWKRPLIELRQLMNTGWKRHSAALVTEFARRHDVELIHTNTFLTPEGGIAARRLGLPHVWHLRELIGRNQPFRLSIGRAALAQFLGQHASLVVANSKASAAAAGDLIPAEILRVVPNGIDTGAFAIRSRSQAIGGPIVLAMVASLSSRTKKHNLFIEAAARLNDLAGVEFRIYGHDPSVGGAQRGDAYVDALHARIQQLSVADRFRFPGYMVDPAQIMAQIDVLVHPTDNESFGRVVVEAMAAGLPVVGVRGGGVGEIVVDGETGLLSSPDDPAALADNIRRVVRDGELRRQLGAAGRLRAESVYSLENCAAGILRVYEEAMALPLGRETEAPRR